ncbi:MAG: PASTA domain-containing protein [Actinomycetota bacterium]
MIGLWIKRGSLVAPLLLLGLALVQAGCGQTAPAIELAAVPELAGLTTQDAEAILLEAGLEMAVADEVFHDTVPAGSIVATMPAAGEEVEAGSTVELTLSKGPDVLPVPSLLGSPEADALATLQAQGLQAEVVRDYSESVPGGSVIAMNPAPDTPLKRGSTVTLTVSLGSAYVTCGTCGGGGEVTTTVTCPDCGGTGTCFT